MEAAIEGPRRRDQRVPRGLLSLSGSRSHLFQLKRAGGRVGGACNPWLENPCLHCLNGIVEIDSREDHQIRGHHPIGLIATATDESAGASLSATRRVTSIARSAARWRLERSPSPLGRSASPAQLADARLQLTAFCRTQERGTPRQNQPTTAQEVQVACVLALLHYGNHLRAPGQGTAGDACAGAPHTAQLG
jgi:hypothetical protein